MKSNKLWNVISESEFKCVMNDVFSDVADVLRNTLGPYGATTIIENVGDYHITKDGLNVLKNIRFEDPMYNNIMSLITRISIQVVYQVGDGSTSAIVAANNIINQFNENADLISKYRPSELLELIQKCVDTIVAKLYANAISVKSDNNYDDIRKIAHIATNGNTEIADIIADIYDKTNNPAIDFSESKTNETTYEIINGYTNSISYIDPIFATGDDGVCAIHGGKNRILLFDHKIDMDTLGYISKAAQYAARQNSRLVVIAPTYDKFLLEHIKATIIPEFKARQTSTVVYCRIPLLNNMSHNMYNDFSVLCDATIMREKYDIPEDEYEKFEPEEFLGQVDSIDIGPKTTTINGFIKRNENMYKIICDDAKSKYDDLLEKYENIGIGDTEIYEARIRLSKLTCRMGTIRVGGNTPLAKRATYDLVDDAVKACSSAFKYGYNVGGGLAVVYAIDNIMNDDTFNISEDERNIYGIIRTAFTGLFKAVLANKYVDDENIRNNIFDSVIAHSKDTGENCGYDLITDSISNDIINSCRTDIEILRGAVSVVSLITTSNQYISVRPRRSDIEE
jgi:chaperonin GroEL (HSP60 family)